jgi:hypothetical protein
MRCLLMLCLIVSAASVLGCKRETSAKGQQLEAPSPSNSYALDSEQLQKAISKAEAGDVEAMNALVDYYWIYRDDGQEQGLLWLKRAADAGDFDAKKAFLAYCKEHRLMKTCVASH